MLTKMSIFNDFRLSQQSLLEKNNVRSHQVIFLADTKYVYEITTVSCILFKEAVYQFFPVFFFSIEFPVFFYMIGTRRLFFFVTNPGEKVKSTSAFIS